MADFKAIILAGGSGERFWPLSTPEKPKQFLNVFGGDSLIRQSVRRLRGLVEPQDVFVITSKALVAATRRELPEIPRANIVGEPMRRDTGAAVALGVGLASLGSTRVGLGSRRVTLGSDKVGLGSDRVTLGSDRVTLGSDRVTLGSKRVGFGAACEASINSKSLATLTDSKSHKTLIDSKSLETLIDSKSLKALIGPKSRKALTGPNRLETLIDPNLLETLTAPNLLETLTDSNLLETLTDPNDSRDTVLGFFPSDQLAMDPVRFRKAIAAAIAKAKKSDSIVTIGIKPDYPATQFGYVNPKTGRFVEKPDARKAKLYLKKGYLWNAGMFIGRVETFRRAFADHAPELLPLLTSRVSRPASLKSVYESLPRISFDFAVMEKLHDVKVVKGDFGWDDVGSYGAFDKYFPHDSRGNVREGPCTVVEADGNICVARSARISLLGVKNLVVVTTPDYVLVADKGRVAEMKKLFARQR